MRVLSSIIAAAALAAVLAFSSASAMAHGHHHGFGGFLGRVFGDDPYYNNPYYAPPPAYGYGGYGYRYLPQWHCQVYWRWVPGLFGPVREAYRGPCSYY